jgi:transposase
MLNTDYIKELIGFEDVLVTNVENFGEEIHISMEIPRKIHICPNCGYETDIIHDYRKQKIKDLPTRHMNTFLYLRKRRYKCPLCNKKFSENVPFLPKYYRVTRRLIESIIYCLKETRTIKSIAKEHNVSCTTAARYIDLVSFPKPNLPPQISIDEYRGNAGGEKFQCIVTDPKKKRILDLLPVRNSDNLKEYFMSFEDRNNVKVVVMDMSSLFKGVAKTCFPNADIVADKFHVMRQGIWAFENVRKEEQKKFSKEYRRYFKRSKSLLIKNPSKLKEHEIDMVVIMLNTSERLRDAYYLLQSFRDIFKCDNRMDAKRELSNWMLKAEIADISEFQACVNTMDNWKTEILNMFEYGFSNGYTEGCNNKTKVLKRISYGCPNFNRFRIRRLSLV